MSETDFISAPFIRPRNCVGGLLDIPAGRFYKGQKNDNVLSGGFTNFIGCGGRGNTFKTTLLLSLCLIVLKRYDLTKLVVYDAELTFEWARIEDICIAMGIDFDDLVSQTRLVLTSSGEHSGNEWWGIVRSISQRRAKDRKRLQVGTPFTSKHGGITKSLPLEMHLLDSMSQLQTDAIEDIYNKNEIDSGAANTDALRGAAIKTRMVMQAPSITTQGGLSLLATAHIGDEMKLDQYAPFKQQLMFLKKGLKFKNCPEKFTFLTSICYAIASAEPKLNKDKAAEYPAPGFKGNVGDTDLMELDLIIIRSKHGPSGHNFSLLVSQTEGYLPTLSEYNYLKDRKDKFGLLGPEGVHQNYRLALYPDLLIKRNDIREEIGINPKLCRALEITSELCQMYDYWVDYPREEVVAPSDLYNKLKEMGYDWNLLLDTRGYWTYDHYENPVKPLSTQDLLDMYFGRYVPWWYPNPKDIKLELAVKSPINAGDIVYGADPEKD